MADEIYSSALAMAEDIRLIRKGGGPLTDDDNLSERQVLYWIAVACADMVREAAKQPVVDERLWVEVVGKATLLPDKCAWMSSCSMAGVAVRLGKPLVRNVKADWRVLEERNTSELAGQTAGFGRFAQAVGVYFASMNRIKIALPLIWGDTETISYEAVLIPNANTIIGDPEAPLPVPSEWHAAIKQQVLANLQPLSAGAPDQVNNGTDRRSDKR
jgi:hypothetical protein